MRLAWNRYRLNQGKTMNNLSTNTEIGNCIGALELGDLARTIDDATLEANTTLTAGPSQSMPCGPTQPALMCRHIDR
jgi:hypothetical protein